MWEDREICIYMTSFCHKILQYDKHSLFLSLYQHQLNYVEQKWKFERLWSIFFCCRGAPCDITLLNFHTSLNVNYRQKIEMGTAIDLISPKWPFDVFICIILCKSELDKSLSSKVRPNSTLLISIIGSKFLISSPSASTFSPCKTRKYLFVCWMYLN